MDFRSIGQKIASTEGVELHVKAPNGEPLYAVQRGKAWSLTMDDGEPGALPCILRVVSKDSKVFRRRNHELLDSLRKQKDMKAAKAEIESFRLIAAGVVGWSNIVWPDAEGVNGLLQFSDENLMEFLMTYREAADQVNEYIADRANFFKAA